MSKLRGYGRSSWFSFGVNVGRLECLFSLGPLRGDNDVGPKVKASAGH